jgi:hypothetical protein
MSQDNTYEQDVPNDEKECIKIIAKKNQSIHDILLFHVDCRRTEIESNDNTISGLQGIVSNWMSNSTDLLHFDSIQSLQQSIDSVSKRNAELRQSFELVKDLYVKNDIYLPGTVEVKEQLAVVKTEDIGMVEKEEYIKERIMAKRDYFPVSMIEKDKKYLDDTLDLCRDNGSLWATYETTEYPKTNKSALVSYLYTIMKTCFDVTSTFTVTDEVQERPIPSKSSLGLPKDAKRKSCPTKTNESATSSAKRKKFDNDK